MCIESFLNIIIVINICVLFIINLATTTYGQIRVIQLVITYVNINIINYRTTQLKYIHLFLFVLVKLTNIKLMGL